MTVAGIQVSSLKAFLKTPEEVYETFSRLGAMGCRMVQLQWIAPEVPNEVIADALQKAGLYSVSTQDHYGAVTADLENVLQLNDLCGSTHVCVSGIPTERRSYEGCIQFAEELNELSRRLEKVGKVLSFHPRCQEFDCFNGISGVELLMEHTRKEICLGLDLYHVRKAGLDGAEWIHRYADRIDFVHFKDCVHLPDGSERLVPAGQGETDWTPMVQACLEANIPWAFVEQERWDKDAFLCMQEAFDWLVEQGFAPQH